MGGDNLPDNPSSNKAGRGHGKDEPTRPGNQNLPESGHQGFAERQGHEAAGDPAQSSREEAYSSSGVAIARQAEHAFLQKAVDKLIPLYLTNIQAIGNPYQDTVVDLGEKARRQFSLYPDGPLKTDLIDYQKQADAAIMDHKDYTQLLVSKDPNLSKADVRRNFFALSLGNCIDPPGDEISTLAGGPYWDEVLSKGGQLLDPNSKNPDEQKRWARQAELFAQIGSRLLYRNDNPLLHPQQIDCKNIDDNLRALTEPLPLPEDFEHHLPEQFSTSIFVDKDGKPREFNVREICERELEAIFKGKMTSDLDLKGLNQEQIDEQIQKRAQELAVLEFYKLGLEQVLPWWTIDQDLKAHLDDMTAKGVKFLDADGKPITNDTIVTERNKFSNDMLLRLEDEFKLFLDQVKTVKADPDSNWAQRWYDARIRAVQALPSTAQAKHFTKNAEAAAFTDEQKKQRCWDTRYQTDAELVKEAIKLKPWQHLYALQDSVATGLLFTEGKIKTPGAQLPTTMRVNLRAIRSGYNEPEFRDPSDTKDLACVWAKKKLMNDFKLPPADPAIFGSSIVMPDGRQIKIASQDQINKQISDELNKWNTSGHPWTLAYIPKTSNAQDTIRRDALTMAPDLLCKKQDDFRRLAIDSAQSGSQLEDPDPLVRAKAMDAQDEARRQLDTLRRNPNGLCPCQQERGKGMDSFGNTAYNANEDPLLRTVMNAQKK